MSEYEGVAKYAAITGHEPIRALSPAYRRKAALICSNRGPRRRCRLRTGPRAE
jgi:hypothetical protein